jgi:hypothetical protein
MPSPHAKKRKIGQLKKRIEELHWFQQKEPSDEI